MAATRDRKAEILESSAQLFASRGVSRTTVREIGEAAGVFSGSLYHYFKSKDAIVAELMSGFMDDIQARFGEVEKRSGTPLEVIEGLIHETLAVIEQYPHETAIYQQDRGYLRDHGLLGAVDDASRKVRQHWVAAIGDGVAVGLFRDDITPEVFYRSVRDTLWSTMHWPDRRNYSLDEFATLMSRLFLRGYCTDHAPAEAVPAGGGRAGAAAGR
ncbi:TetR/AcrR family transcriptional regulator [Tomitella cavernea]|uniref:TetR family transcriptional regulator KstR2 n=1 Tax=Tomitella cavernea TaxID=1387982 RepID=A0ABP9C3X4_9ACTN|nr:TetR/AcrR family transcriptional regulator [Tomitella cavernea]